ncbi:DUF309 domain-containing protein [Brevibacillus massiliensis]|jgi:hypothetical protein|uniref:DUF309 domain-containing protein n=1 Tax=Brevibacillus massiliensis TaxID=1118054 RepID=UPI0002F3008B|nr:DUF309 domain-containing protein [Brevibacillus massiliensis]
MMKYPDAYIRYLVHFHGDRDYFECHEILEEYWKELGKPQDPVWVGLIQLAVALYHQRRGNFAGGMKMMASAIRNLETTRASVRQLGLDDRKLLALLRQRLAGLEQNQPYTSLNLPFSDEQLLLACSDLCRQNGMTFGQPSDESNRFLLHKHTLRDRSGVISERLNSLKNKHGQS